MLAGRVWRALALLAVAVVEAGAAGASSGGVPSCRTAQLKVSTARTGVAAGTVGGEIVFTNRSATRCRLSGWPTVVAEAPAVAPTSGVRRHSTMFGPYVHGVPVVALARGERAVAFFTAPDNPSSGRRGCGPRFRSLRVTPPANLRSRVVSAWIVGLARFLPNCGPIEVSMVVREPRSDQRATTWERLRSVVRSCQAERVEQTHNRLVTVTLRDGSGVFAYEPTLDAIIPIVNEADRRCPSIVFATE